jgi:hypothetical protein
VRDQGLTRIVARVVADHLDERRLQGLVMIGCDEISYRRGQRYLTSVVDHASGAIVWCAPGRNAATLQGFFELLGHPGRGWSRSPSSLGPSAATATGSSPRSASGSPTDDCKASTAASGSSATTASASTAPTR